MKYKAILSDLDKTLIEDLLVPPYIIRRIGQYLQVHEEKASKIVRNFYKIQTSRAHFLNGYSKVGAWKRVLLKNGISYTLQQLVDINTLFWDTAAEFSRPYPGVIQSLKRIKEMGITFGVVSGGDYITRYQHLKASGILPFVDNLVTTEEIGYVKHEQNLFAHAAMELQTSPQETLVVGDNEVADIELPKKEGFTTVKIAHNGGPTIADYTVRNFSEILNLL